MMTRKDFELIARVIRDARPLSEDLSNPGVRVAHQTLNSLSAFMADALYAQNPRFDRARFLAACQVCKI